jgi:hypothetical protein
LISGNSGTDIVVDDYFCGGLARVYADAYNVIGDSSKTLSDAIYLETGLNFTPGPTDITATSDGTSPSALEDILDITLRGNGGPTKTLALVEGSPAVDAGGPDCPPPDTDQRGFPRPEGGACDIGAFEGAVGLINDRVTFAPKPSTDETTRDKEGCPPNYWGKYLFEAALTNVGGQDLNALAIQIEKLTRKNLVLAPDSTLLGEGDRLSVPPEGAYADWVLGPSEVVNVPIEICLKRRRSFQFFADVYGSVSEGAPGTASLTR